MSEVEMMYKKVGVKKLLYCDICKAQEHALGLCAETKCEPFYPPFTAEKQLELIKLISGQGQVIIENWEKDNKGFNVTFRANSNLRYITMDCITRKTVEEALAQIVNDLWQDLTEQERTEIAEILEDNQ